MRKPEDYKMIVDALPADGSEITLMDWKIALVRAGNEKYAAWYLRAKHAGLLKVRVERQNGEPIIYLSRVVK